MKTPSQQLLTASGAQRAGAAGSFTCGLQLHGCIAASLLSRPFQGSRYPKATALLNFRKNLAVFLYFLSARQNLMRKFPCLIESMIQRECLEWQSLGTGRDQAESATTCPQHSKQAPLFEESLMCLSLMCCATYVL